MADERTDRMIPLEQMLGLQSMDKVQDVANQITGAPASGLRALLGAAGVQQGAKPGRSITLADYQAKQSAKKLLQPLKNLADTTGETLGNIGEFGGSFHKGQLAQSQKNQQQLLGLPGKVKDYSNKQLLANQMVQNAVGGAGTVGKGLRQFFTGKSPAELGQDTGRKLVQGTQAALNAPGQALDQLAQAAKRSSAATEKSSGAEAAKSQRQQIKKNLLGKLGM